MADEIQLASKAYVDAAISGASVPGAMRQATFLFTEAATESAHSYAITAVDTVAGSFTIAGDHTDEFKTCTWFYVEGSTGNDSSYGITSAVFSAGSTVIVVDSAVGDATADGVIVPAAYKALFTIPAGAVIHDIIVIPLAQWAADFVNVYIADEAHAYMVDVDLTSTGLVVFDPTNVVGPSGTQGSFEDAKHGRGDYVSALGFHQLSNAAAGYIGPGVPYDTETDLYMQILTRIAAPPVAVPTGRTLFRVEYFDAATPTAAAFL